MVTRQRPEIDGRPMAGGRHHDLRKLCARLGRSRSDWANVDGGVLSVYGLKGA